MNQNELELIALRSALGWILIGVPEDLSEQSTFMRWYRDTDDVLECPTTEVWEPFEYFNKNNLRGVIADAALSYLQAMLIARQPLIEALRLKSEGDKHADIV